MYINVSIGTDRPTLKLLNEFVRNDIASKWEDLGVMLLDEKQRSTLSNIAKNKQKVEDRCAELFKCWLELYTDASWNKLLEALEKIEQHSLAKKIKINVLKGIDITPFTYVATPVNEYVAS